MQKLICFRVYRFYNHKNLQLCFINNSESEDEDDGSGKKVTSCSRFPALYFVQTNISLSRTTATLTAISSTNRGRGLTWSFDLWPSLAPGLQRERMPYCRAETGSGHGSEGAEGQTGGRTAGARGAYRKEKEQDWCRMGEIKMNIVCCSVWKGAVQLLRGNIWSVGSCRSVRCSSSVAWKLLFSRTYMVHTHTHTYPWDIT